MTQFGASSAQLRRFFEEKGTGDFRKFFQKLNGHYPFWNPFKALLPELKPAINSRRFLRCILKFLSP